MKDVLILAVGFFKIGLAIIVCAGMLGLLFGLTVRTFKFFMGLV